MTFLTRKMNRHNEDKDLLLSKGRVLALVLVLAISLGAGCKKSEGKLPQEEPDQAEQKDSGYVALIQAHTDLIKSLVRDTGFVLFDGVKETDIQYINKEDKPMAVFILTVDLSHPGISMEVGTANNKTDFTHQTVTKMISYKNRAHSSKEVIAAFNGDYWQVHSGQEVPVGHPLGPVYKDGEMIKDFPENRYYFLAILKKNTACIGDNDYYNYRLDHEDIEEALGGRYLLLKDGIDVSGNLNKNVEPRTSVGLLSPEKIVFIVVDGRRAGYSVGISMQNLAKLFKAIGAKDAINLDGGGSATFVVKEHNNYVTRNKPSGNAERPVVNSWMIMCKK